jgi:hypothetical protein
MNRSLLLLATTLFLSASTLSLNGQIPESTSEAACTSAPRSCLDLTLNSYLKALLVHKPEALPVSANMKFTENGVERKLGEGLWQTLTKFNVEEGGTKLEFIDLPKGTAGLHIIARVAWEGIKIYDGQIHAIEGFAGSF